MMNHSDHAHHNMHDHHNHSSMGMHNGGHDHHVMDNGVVSHEAAHHDHGDAGSDHVMKVRIHVHCNNPLCMECIEQM